MVLAPLSPLSTRIWTFCTFHFFNSLIITIKKYEYPPKKQEKRLFISKEIRIFVL